MGKEDAPLTAGGVAEIPQVDHSQPQVEAEAVEAAREQFGAVAAHGGESVSEMLKAGKKPCGAVEQMGELGIRLVNQMAADEQNPGRGLTANERIAAKKQAKQQAEQAKLASFGSAKKPETSAADRLGVKNPTPSVELAPPLAAVMVPATEVVAKPMVMVAESAIAPPAPPEQTLAAKKEVATVLSEVQAQPLTPELAIQADVPASSVTQAGLETADQPVAQPVVSEAPELPATAVVTTPAFAPMAIPEVPAEQTTTSQTVVAIFEPSPSIPEVKPDPVVVDQAAEVAPVVETEILATAQPEATSSTVETWEEILHAEPQEQVVTFAEVLESLVIGDVPGIEIDDQQDASQKMLVGNETAEPAAPPLLILVEQLHVMEPEQQAVAAPVIQQIVGAVHAIQMLEVAKTDPEQILVAEAELAVLCSELLEVLRLPQDEMLVKQLVQTMLQPEYQPTVKLASEEVDLTILGTREAKRRDAKRRLGKFTRLAAEARAGLHHMLGKLLVPPAIA